MKTTTGELMAMTTVELRAMLRVVVARCEGATKQALIAALAALLGEPRQVEAESK